MRLKTAISVFATSSLLHAAPVLAAPAAEWMLVGQSGQCIPMSAFDEVGGSVRTPYELARQLQDAGQKVAITEIPVDKGKSVLIEVTDRKVPMIFATANNCRSNEPPGNLTRKQKSGSTNR